MEEWQAVVDVLAKQSDVIAADQVPARCVERVRWKLDRELWQRGHDGIFIAHSGRATLEQRIWVAVLGGGDDAAACGPTAAAMGDLVGFERDILHVLIPWQRKGPAIDGVKYHRSRRAYAEDVAEDLQPPRVKLPIALASMAARAYTDAAAHRILTSAVQQRLVRAQHIREVVLARPKLPRRRLILETLLDIEDGAQSLNEVAMRRLARRNRLPAPTLQLVAATEDRRSRLDGGWPEFGVYFEIDGAGHFEITKWLDDADRHNEAALALEPGSTLLRWPGFVVRRQPDRVIDQARRALTRGGWRADR